MIATSVPGRVNLIGEHTDYNAGLVLPTPIPQRTRVVLAPQAGDRVMVTSRELGASVGYRLGEERRGGTWLDYVMGCTAMLREAGHQVAGCILEIESDVPVGGGLSSSAALEIAVLRAFREAHGLAVDDVRLALLGQRAEVELVGAPVGVMDQLAASLGQLGEALLIDCRDLAIRSIALPAADLVVITGGGFGGAIVALANLGEGAAAAARVAATYQARTGQTPQVLVPGTDPCNQS